MDGISLLITFIAGAIASFIGSTVGGVTFVAVPVLIFLGLPPQIAIATTRLGGLGLRVSAITKYAKSHKIDWNLVPALCAISVVGVVIGANLLLKVDTALLTRIIGVTLLVILPLLFVNHIGLKRRKPRHKPMGYFTYFLIKIWGGFMGAGAGTCSYYNLMYFFGLPIVRSVATSQIPGLIMNLLSMLIFAWYGIIDYTFGAVLFLGMLLGGWLGASTAVKKGDAWVRIFFAVMVVVFAVKLLIFP
ncbi:MAG: sulfite exporter TauE/SafE family protein [Candidatus Nanoarchaeia archaeon]